jgi:glycosyltransferase involved in cell wall biosynthesis
MNSLVSVVMPTFKQQNFIKKAIQSLIMQTYENWELIIIDNNKDNSSSEIVKSFKLNNIKIFKIKNNGCIAKSRNLGIKKSKGDWVAFLDSDDYWSHQKLELSIKYANLLKADLIYHSLYSYNNSTNKKKVLEDKNINIKKPILNSLLKNGNLIANSSVLVKKKILEQIDLISEDNSIITWEDFDTWLRIAKVTDKFVQVPKTLGYCYTGQGTASSLLQTIKNNENFKKFYFKDIKKLNLKKNLWWTEYPSALKYFKRGDYRQSYVKVKNLTIAPINIYSRILFFRLCFILFYFKSRFSLIKKKITKLFNVVNLYEYNNYFSLYTNYKSNKLIVVDSIIKYQKINKKYHLNLSLEKIKRLYKKDILFLLIKNNQIISSGWSTNCLTGSFYIEEINKKVFFSKSIVLYDFFSNVRFRNKGYFQLLLKIIRNYFKNNKLVIYSLNSNFSSNKGIIRSGFVLKKKLSFFKN